MVFGFACHVMQNKECQKGEYLKRAVNVEKAVNLERNIKRRSRIDCVLFNVDGFLNFPSLYAYFITFSIFWPRSLIG
jgi:hypothetical protein